MRVVTDAAAFRATARDAPAGARIPVEVRIRVPDPFVAYRRARGSSAVERSPGAYLETTGGQSGWGYFAVEPTAFLQVSADAVSLAGPTAGADGTDQFDAARPAALDARHSPSLAALRALLNTERLVRGACDVPYPCGGIGWLSYDVARELEDLPGNTTDDWNLPRLQLATFDRMAAWREPREGETTVRVTACPRVDDDPEVVYEHGLRRASALARRAVEGDPHMGRASTDRLPVDRSAVTFESDCTPDEFAERVQRVKAAIRTGDTFQANISQRLTAPAAVHPVEAFAALRRVNPAPYSALLEFPGLDLVSASPELLLDVSGDRLLTEPIAGTRPRGATADEDARLERDLRGDEKERAEHAMLVDLERNDLGKVADYGSVYVPEYRRIDRYSEVMHLVSVVEGRLREDDDLVDALAAVFPGGTITGAPKPRTMEIIDEVERTRRGPYTGSVGIFGFDGRATLNIIIRTLVRHADEYHLRVGAGIVHDSEPIREYGETLDKARALVTAIDEAPGERADLAVENPNHR